MSPFLMDWFKGFFTGNPHDLNGKIYGFRWRFSQENQCIDILETLLCSLSKTSRGPISVAFSMTSTVDKTKNCSFRSIGCCHYTFLPSPKRIACHNLEIVLQSEKMNKNAGSFRKVATWLPNGLITKHDPNSFGLGYKEFLKPWDRWRRPTFSQPMWPPPVILFLSDV